MFYPSSQIAVAVSPNSTPVYENCPFRISPAEPHNLPFKNKKGKLCYKKEILTL